MMEGHELCWKIASSGQPKYNPHVAGVAQLVEQRIRNAKVEGSIPFTGTIFSWLETLAENNSP